MTRTYDDIYAEITNAVNAKAEVDSKRDDFWTAQVNLSQRLHDLWHEIVELAVVDKQVPGWARIAAAAVRQQHADKIEEYRKLIEKYAG